MSATSKQHITGEYWMMFSLQWRFVHDYGLLTLENENVLASEQKKNNNMQETPVANNTNEHRKGNQNRQSEILVIIWRT